MTHQLTTADIESNRTLFDELLYPSRSHYSTPDGIELRPFRGGHPPAVVVRSQYDVRGREIGR